MGATSTVEVYSRQSDNTGEGPLWSVAEQTLYWIDIGRKLLYRRGPLDLDVSSWTLPDYPGCLAEHLPGSIMIAMGSGLQRMNLISGVADLICAVPNRIVGTRFNDGKVDPMGRFWAGTMQNNFGMDGEVIPVVNTHGALYRIDTDRSVVTIEENVGIANTLAWSPDLKRMYFADSLKGEIFAYDFDAHSGAVCNKRVFFSASDCGLPDGSAIDVDGCLWNARWDGGVILRITPEGKVDRKIPLPVGRPTSCIFGGRNLDVLYVTSAVNGLTPDQLQQTPLAGSVFAIHGAGQGTAVPTISCGLS